MNNIGVLIVALAVSSAVYTSTALYSGSHLTALVFTYPAMLATAAACYAWAFWRSR